MATITINLGQNIRTVPSRFLGANLSNWSGGSAILANASIRAQAQAAGLQVVRFGAGEADSSHFNVAAGGSLNNLPDYLRFTEAIGAVGIPVLGYGSGSPQEGAAVLSYAAGQQGNLFNLGWGPSYSSGWNRTNFQTVDYWASLRAAAPLQVDDGLNFLRISHPQPFALLGFEFASENYLTANVDQNSPAHNANAYAAAAAKLAYLASQINPALKMILGGVVNQVLGGGTVSPWLEDMLPVLAQQGVAPGLISDQCYYNGGSGTETDSGLLAFTGDQAGGDGTRGPGSWATRANYYASTIASGLGLLGGQTELMASFAPRVSAPSPQSVSLVAGLHVADVLGSLMVQKAYQSALFWNFLGKGGSDGVAGAGGIYGWRTVGDAGMVAWNGSAPSRGLGVPYPPFFAYKLVNQMLSGGAVMLGTTSDDSRLSAYGAWCGLVPGELRFLVINKSSSQSITAAFALPVGFRTMPTATVLSYGPTNDQTQQNSGDGVTGVGLTTTTPNFVPSTGLTFPAYSMSLVRLQPLLG